MSTVAQQRNKARKAKEPHKGDFISKIVRMFQGEVIDRSAHRQRPRALEVPDNTPVAVPMGAERPLTMNERIARVMAEIDHTRTRPAGFPTFEEWEARMRALDNEDGDMDSGYEIDDGGYDLSDVKLPSEVSPPSVKTKSSTPKKVAPPTAPQEPESGAE